MESVVGTVLLILTGLFTYQGLRHREYQEKYLFNTDKILIGKEYFRLFSSGFLHANWLHFGLNMIALMAFSYSVENLLGKSSLALIYFFSLLGGSLLALFIHRNHGDYSAVGASGAISGVVAASIILFPHSKISLILIPIEFTSWIFGLLFILISILGIKSQGDNIGHEAHLGGIIIGIFCTLFINPSSFIDNWWVVVVLLFPILLFFYLIMKRPDILITSKWNFQKPDIIKKKKSDKTLDELLDKIKRKGVDSLSKSEKNLLDKYSKNK